MYLATKTKFENAEEWKSTLRLAAEECNYRGIDGQWKEQFMHRLNGNDMLAEIIRDFTNDKHFLIHLLAYIKL